MSDIVAGYLWEQDVDVVGAFPSGVTMTAHVRRAVEAPDILATLTTANGGITRISDDRIRIEITGTASVLWRTSVVIDVVRTDTSPDAYLYFQLAVDVVQPVTRGL